MVTSPSLFFPAPEWLANTKGFSSAEVAFSFPFFEVLDGNE